MTQLQAELEGLSQALDQRGEKSAADRCRKAIAEIQRLTMWVRRIHNINDHPGRFSKEVDDACIDALGGIPPSGPVDAVVPTRQFADKRG